MFGNISLLYDERTYQFYIVPFVLNISNTVFGIVLEARFNIQIPGHSDKIDDL